MLIATFALFFHFWYAVALSPKYLPCQLQKPPSVSPLTGCPHGTILVSKNASDSKTSFSTVQKAISSLPDEGEAIILITEGQYQETVNVTRSGPLTLLGQVSEKYAKAVDRPFASASVPNLVQIFASNYVKPGMDDADSAVLTVAPNRAGALIGSGPTGAPIQPSFGNIDFKAYNIDFQNRAANFSISQALATDISYANASFYGCSFSSYQDTWYTGRNASTYVVDSVIFGQTDYLFGFGTAWFQNIILANRACGGGIVAWKGTNLTDAPGNRYGAYIADSRIIRSPDANSTTDITKKCFLGRPWNDLATTVYLSVFMEDVIQPAGWKAFTDQSEILNTTFYAEFNSTGPGGDTSARHPKSHILDAKEAANFTIDTVFREHPSWIDYNYLC
ncbi:carbohydrate esterase family 8 protein [Moniliophthora roreri MCA 2997]|uniref:pectinesterase n=2 Tax=Moniliophthora roreri TaxID=221103 RepID=V2YVI8_MONRO|nr:carbohydrate esterase family 8 protein [Moniliophthora roreri MCA 2997]KAI3621330.1 carbohydrate esterase family 8 protein [Moniliophthora roreri]